METLNFPKFQFDFKKQDDKILIFDIIRKKHIILTPEEWVRQHLIHFLIFAKSFPRTLIKVESSLHYHKKLKRADIMVYNNKGDIILLAECKAPSVAIGTNALFQIGIYQKSSSPDYLIVTNGLIHYAWKKDLQKNEFKQLKDIPDWATIN